MYAWSPVRSSVRSFYKLYEVLFVRSTNSTKFCSFVLQTLRSSVRSFFKLYEVLLVCSTNSTMLCSLAQKNERLLCTFDLQLNVIMTSTINISTIVLRTDLVYRKGTLLSQIFSVLSTALIYHTIVCEMLNVLN